MDNKLINWLLAGDPAVRYQLFKDILKADAETIAAERKQITLTGWGKALLDRQDESGTWSNAIYSPKWTSTFYTLLLLKQLGALALPQITKACQLLLDKGFYADGGISYWKSYPQSETCVTGMLLSVLCHFGVDDERINSLYNFLAAEQMKDGGWNCNKVRGAVHSSFHTTLSVLEALWKYENIKPDKVREILTLRLRGMEFLLQHRLFKSSRTGNKINPQFSAFVFPTGWKYDVMRCLDFAREINADRDERFTDAILLLKSKQLPDGSWKTERKHSGKYFFDLEKTGQPGRWNTIRASRILNWWELNY